MNKSICRNSVDISLTDLISIALLQPKHLVSVLQDNRNAHLLMGMSVAAVMVNAKQQKEAALVSD
jgi:hypothetical protein